jgi:NADH:ubiquinone oxidoreductase subunit 2 (subunit N)
LVYLSVILVLTTVASYWYYLRVAWFMWMRDAPSDDDGEPIHVPFAMRLALIAGVILIVYLGVFPGATMELARASVIGPASLGSELIGLAP